MLVSYCPLYSRRARCNSTLQTLASSARDSRSHPKRNRLTLSCADGCFALLQPFVHSGPRDVQFVSEAASFQIDATVRKSTRLPGTNLLQFSSIAFHQTCIKVPFNVAASIGLMPEHGTEYRWVTSGKAIPCSRMQAFLHSTRYMSETSDHSRRTLSTTLKNGFHWRALKHCANTSSLDRAERSSISSSSNSRFFESSQHLGSVGCYELRD
jgi:hypothetical protein